MMMMPYENFQLIQLRTFRKRFAELRNHFGTAAKIQEDEIGEKGSKEAEQELIKVDNVNCCVGLTHRHVHTCMSISYGYDKVC